MNTKKLLGQRIKEIRKSKNLTQEKLAELINLETSSLSGIESGRHYPSLPTLEKIAQNLDVNICSLFDYNHLDNIDDIKVKIIENIGCLEDEKIRFIYEFMSKSLKI